MTIKPLNIAWSCPFNYHVQEYRKHLFNSSAEVRARLNLHCSHGFSAMTHNSVVTMGSGGTGGGGSGSHYHHSGGNGGSAIRRLPDGSIVGGMIISYIDDSKNNKRKCSWCRSLVSANSSNCENCGGPNDGQR
jgi:hypothetical protein